MHVPPIRLGVNVDHVATLRQARGTSFPDPVHAAAIAELAGADQITVHLREDRRHIQDRDVRLLRQTVQTRLNLEMAVTPEMLTIGLELGPDMITLVPERREERTTEGGLDVVGHYDALATFIERLRPSGAHISLFVDPDMAQLDACARLGVDLVELHTGDYCHAPDELSNRSKAHHRSRHAELERIRQAASFAQGRGLLVAAGHGLDYRNVVDIAAIVAIEELNIGHSIISHAVMVGLERAVSEMIAAMARGRRQANI